MEREKSHNKVINIAGMHRSGTSLMAGWLQKAGLFIGDDLLSGFSDNKYGHFEDVQFLEFHREILRMQGLDSRGLMLKDKTTFHFNHPWKEEAEFLVQKRNSIHETWGWKEPRSTLFLEEWKKVLPSLKVVAIFRPPEYVIHSLYKRLKRNKWYPTRNPVLKLKWHFQVDRDPGKWINEFSNAYVIYNQKVLNFAERFPEDVLILDLEHLVDHAGQVIPLINEKFDLSLKNVPIMEVFDEKILTHKEKPLLSKPIPREALDIHALLKEKEIL